MRCVTADSSRSAIRRSHPPQRGHTSIDEPCRLQLQSVRSRLCLMISNDAIAQAVRILVDAAKPIKVILFGSYATGNAQDDSDVDLLVVERGLRNKRAEMVRLRNLVRPLRIPVDIIVVSEDEFRDWAHLTGTVLHWAATEGRVMHEATA